MGRVVSGWEHEQIVDYGACGVRLGARTDSTFETNWNTNVGLTIYLLSGLVATAYNQHTIYESTHVCGCKQIRLPNSFK